MQIRDPVILMYFRKYFGVFQTGLAESGLSESGLSASGPSESGRSESTVHSWTGNGCGIQIDEFSAQTEPYSWASELSSILSRNYN